MTRRRIQPDDRPAVVEMIERHWPAKVIFSSGKVYTPDQVDGYGEWRDEKLVGLLTFVHENQDLHLLTLNSTVEGQHVASGLMLLAIDEARRNSARRIWFTTTNDNVRLMGFYQRLGFRLTGVSINVVDEVRKIKPQVPEVGHDGIAIHDELVLELDLKPCTA